MENQRFTAIEISSDDNSDDDDDNVPLSRCRSLRSGNTIVEDLSKQKKPKIVSREEEVEVIQLEEDSETENEYENRNKTSRAAKDDVEAVEQNRAKKKDEEIDNESVDSDYGDDDKLPLTRALRASKNGEDNCANRMKSKMNVIQVLKEGEMENDDRYETERKRKRKGAENDDQEETEEEESSWAKRNKKEKVADEESELDQMKRMRAVENEDNEEERDEVEESADEEAELEPEPDSETSGDDEEEDEPPEDAKPIGEVIRVAGKGSGKRNHYESFEYDGTSYYLEDPVLLVPEDQSKKPYVAIIKDISQTMDGKMMVTGQWFYRPEEAEKRGGGNWQFCDARELFYSFHQDEVPAESVMHKCVVHFIPLNKQIPDRKEHPGFIVQKVYDTEQRRLFKLTDKDYEDTKQQEIDILVQKTMARIGDLPDIEPEHSPAASAGQEEHLKCNRPLRRKNLTSLDVSRDGEAPSRPGHSKAETLGSCASNASEYFTILSNFKVLTGETQRDKWLEKLLQSFQFLCNPLDNVQSDNKQKGGSDVTNLNGKISSVKHVNESLESSANGNMFQWPDTAVPAVVALEKAAQEALSSDFQKYNQKMRQLTFNFKNNFLLARRLLNGGLEPSQILNMSPNELREGLTAEEIASRKPEEPEPIQMTNARCNRCTEKKVQLLDIIQAGHRDRYQEMSSKQPWVTPPPHPPACGGMPSLPPAPPALMPLPPERPSSSSTPPPFIPASSPSDEANSSYNTSQQEQVVGRPVVTLDTEGLVPSRQCSASITHSFRNGLHKDGINWKAVPQQLKNAYFEEFKKNFCWDSDIEKRVRAAWEARAANRYKDFVYKLKAGGTQKPFIPDEVWQNWLSLWACEDVVRKGEIASRNRKAAGTDGKFGTYTGGSIKATVHRRRMAKDWGREPTANELFLHLNTYNHDGETFVDAKAQVVHERFEKLKESCLQTGDNTTVDESQLFYEAVGGRRKGHVFGIGSDDRYYYGHTLRASITGSDTCLTAPSTSQQPSRVPREDIVDMVKDVVHNVVKEKLDQFKPFLLDMIGEWMTSLGSTSAQPNPAPEPTPSTARGDDVHSDEHMDDFDSDHGPPN